MGVSRREILMLSFFAPIWFPLSRTHAADEKEPLFRKDAFPRSIAVLKEAFVLEMVATRNYVGYSRKALSESYPNIAYLFIAFSESEKIHADNYRKTLLLLGETPEIPTAGIDISNTKDNLQKAAENERAKITHFYPEFIKRLQPEAHDSSVVSCMYSWRSHKQHEAEINKILKYSERYFGHVAKKIEGMDLHYFVCNNCGSTLSKPPEIPCTICNYPMKYYRNIDRPS